MKMISTYKLLYLVLTDFVSGDGKLQIEELLANIEVLNEHSVNGEQLMAAFNTFDVNKDGFIRY